MPSRPTTNKPPLATERGFCFFPGAWSSGCVYRTLPVEPLSPEHTAVLRPGVDMRPTVTLTAGKQTIHMFASDSAGCPALEPLALRTRCVLGCGVDVGSVHAIKLDWLAYRRLMRSKRKPGALAGSTCHHRPASGRKSGELQGSVWIVRLCVAAVIWFACHQTLRGYDKR